ncbi:MAG: nitronate monooxygenase, partial [Actinomycetota bacterium]
AFVEQLERSGAATGLLRALRNAVAFRKLTGTPLRAMLREGIAMRRTLELSWAQVLMAANTPMMLRAAMVEGDLRYGVMASGQVVGVIDDLPGVAELIERIVHEAEGTLGRLGV